MINYLLDTERRKLYKVANIINQIEDNDDSFLLFDSESTEDSTEDFTDEDNSNILLSEEQLSRIKRLKLQLSKDGMRGKWHFTKQELNIAISITQICKQ